MNFQSTDHTKDKNSLPPKSYITYTSLSGDIMLASDYAEIIKLNKLSSQMTTQVQLLPATVNSDFIPYHILFRSQERNFNSNKSSWREDMSWSEFRITGRFENL
jgi:hypothetical protein